MEEEATEPLGVGVEAECVGTFAPLGDVAREDDDEEAGDDPPDGHPLAPQREEREPEADLHQPRRDHDHVGIDREPIGDLGLELVALRGQMADAGEHQCSAEHPATDVAAPVLARVGGRHVGGHRAASVASGLSSAVSIRSRMMRSANRSSAGRPIRSTSAPGT